ALALGRRVVEREPRELTHREVGRVRLELLDHLGELAPLVLGAERDRQVLAGRPVRQVAEVERARADRTLRRNRGVEGLDAGRRGRCEREQGKRGNETGEGKPSAHGQGGSGSVREGRLGCRWYP